jgi:hypothetical protein
MTGKLPEGPKPVPEADPLSPAQIAHRLDAAVLRLEKSVEPPSKTTKSWWTVAIEFLALPAAVLAIVIQITQTKSTAVEQDKTVAETEKIKTEEIKTRVEIEGLVDSLAEKKQKGIQIYRAELERTLPLMQNAVERLSTLEAQSTKGPITQSLAKFVILWIVLIGVGLVFNVIGQLWSTLLTAGTLTLFNRKAPKDPSSRLRHERWKRIATWAHPILGPMPSVLHWAIELAIFITLLVPLFDETMSRLGVDLKFATVLEDAKRFKISDAIAAVSKALFC